MLVDTVESIPVPPQFYRLDKKKRDDGGGASTPMVEEEGTINVRCADPTKVGVSMPIYRPAVYSACFLG